MDKQPPMVDTTPENLVLLDAKVVKRFAQEAFLE